MIDASKKYQTRDGREVRIYATDSGGLYPVHGAIRSDEENLWGVDSWRETGSYVVGYEAKEDLIEVKDND